MEQTRLKIRKVGMVALLGATLILLNASVVCQATSEGDLAPLPVKPPAPTLKGTPTDLPSGPNIEPPPQTPLPPFMAPHGVINLATGKKVTTSTKPFSGVPAQITDGRKEPEDDQVVEMRRGKQWVQVDLGEPARIFAIVVWHDHRWLQVFRDVVIQVADDADFTRNVQTIYNNDMDNSAGLGIGTDKEYFETHHGRTFDARGVVARYVRCYTAGSTLSALNVCQEVEVYGFPAN
jgi:hypothetical protein